jgi:hypothetical protein
MHETDWQRLIRDSFTSSRWDSAVRRLASGVQITDEGASGEATSLALLIR